jgi:hypothetical protein
MYIYMEKEREIEYASQREEGDARGKIWVELCDSRSACVLQLLLRIVGLHGRVWSSIPSVCCSFLVCVEQCPCVCVPCLVWSCVIVC